jgi:hypothetical protein
MPKIGAPVALMRLSSRGAYLPAMRQVEGSLGAVLHHHRVRRETLDLDAALELDAPVGHQLRRAEGGEPVRYLLGRRAHAHRFVCRLWVDVAWAPACCIEACIGRKP